MTLVKFNRTGRDELARLHNEMDDLFHSFFPSWDKAFGGRKLWPAIDLAEDENSITVKAEVPGCKAEDIDISVHGSTLTISGEKKQSQEKEEKGYYYSETSFGSFRREIDLPNEVDAAKIAAACKNGVLTIKLPKAEVAKAIKVKIKEE